MSKRIHLTVKIDTDAPWTQVDVIDRWIKVVHVDPEPLLTGNIIQASYPQPFDQYRPAPTFDDDEPFNTADFTPGATTLIHLDNPRADQIQARLHLALEMPDDLGEDAAYSVQTVRFGVAKSEQGHTHVTFGIDEYPTIRNGWGGRNMNPRGWPHLICDVPVTALLDKAAEEMDAAHPVVAGVAGILQESADVFARSRQKTTDKADKVLSDEIFRRPPV
ncbi:MAG: hypothetical protein KC418_04505 [Anaerolineales bacterium]|nr:hypothetical protein [Anaerolineales bacterium]MCB8952844.1 hypothetical protein [Ardenticatenales bacterium]